MKVYKRTLTNKIMKTVSKGLDEHSRDCLGEHAVEKPISFYYIDEQKNIISAIVIQMFLGTMHIKKLWTHKNYRRKGYAIKLMELALNFAKENNCLFVTVVTTSYHAPDFYKKFGFRVEFKRDGYLDHSIFYMRKDL